MEERARGQDGVRAGAPVALADVTDHRDFWKTEWRVDKFNGRDIDAWCRDELSSAQKADFDRLQEKGLLESVLSPRLDLRSQPRAADLQAELFRLRALFHEVEKPDDVLVVPGNILVTAGINLMLGLLNGAGGTVFSNANAHLGVGDSTTAENAAQTDLQAATNKLRKAMNGSYPTAAAGGSTQYQSTFGTSEANFDWEEVGCFNASSAGTMLNRKVASLGTKASGASWTLTLTVTIT